MSRMNDVLAIITASGDSFDDLISLMNPDDHSKEEIQETYEEVFGYDPTTYFDRKALKHMLDHLKESDELPNDVISILDEELDSIIEEALEKFESNREDHLSSALNSVIEEKTGYNPNMDFDDDIDENDYVDDYDD